MSLKIFDMMAKIYKSIRGFYKMGSKPFRFLKYFLTTLIFLLILTAAAAEYTSRPSFCPTCHYMETFYQSWRTSAHNKIDCVECHFEPGISGTVRGKLNGLVQIVNYVSLSYKKRKPWAEIPDNTCARAGCHETQELKDSVYNFKGVLFNHKNHLQEQRRGKTLKCTSCHSQIVQGTHIEVTAATCYNCHFKKSDDPEHKYTKLSQCSTCHKWENKSQEDMIQARFNHTVVIENKMSCYDCHTNTVVGNGEVRKERCYQCHFETERLDKYDDTEFMHKAHISKHSMKCFSCHTQIQHQVQKIDASLPPDCSGCHANAHTSQVSLFTGENGYNVEKSPSVMFLNGINCKGCHAFHELDKKGIETSVAKSKSCEKCHGTGYDRLIEQWEAGTVKRLSIIKSIYNTTNQIVKFSNSDRKSEATEIMLQAEHNINTVEIGKSVHNVQFAERLLIGSYGLMKKALSVIGSSKLLPDFISTEEIIPNECYSCHSGIQEISRKKFDMDFSHNQHIVNEKIACIKCHSNTKKHGEFILNKTGCNNCHHAKSKNNDACEKCHKMQTNLYNGRFGNKNQPDIMKEGGVGCIDCHIASDKVFKPDSKICLKCHESGYDDQMIDWKKDISKLIIEANSLLDKTKNKDLSDEDKVQVNEIRKLVNQISSYPSIYVHNYDLLSSVLSDKMKILKTYK